MVSQLIQLSSAIHGGAHPVVERLYVRNETFLSGVRGIPPPPIFAQSPNHLYGGFLKWGTPNSWMVFVREHPNLKWMMTGGTPMT